MPDTAFVFNPSAQSGRAAARWDEIESLAQEIGIRFVRFDTEPERGRAMQLVEELAVTPQVRTIACLGGDGTVSAAIQGLMRAQDKRGISREALPALAIVPFGTGNDVAKSFGIPVDPGTGSLRKAIETIKFGADFKLDLGCVDGIYFADAFSIGVDPAILQDRNRERERLKTNPVMREVLRDYGLYLLSALRRGLKYRHVAARLYLDDRPVIKIRYLTNLIVNNTKVYAGEFVFQKDSRANDGLLDVILFTGWWDYFSKFFSSVRSASPDQKQIDQFLVKHSKNYQAKRIKIMLSRKRATQVDGEEHRTGHDFEIKCVENALTLKTPVG